MANERHDNACSESNKVVIRIWTSGLNKTHPGNNVGHVSIETTTPKGYMSLWPDGSPHSKQIISMLEKRDAYYMSDYQEDLDAEHRRPELTYCLYTLDAYKICEEFKCIQKDNKGWTLLGNNIFVHEGKSHSCATMVYELLKAGGIYDMVSSGHSFTFSSTVAPDTLIPALKAAKKYELKHFPQSASFSENTILNNKDEFTEKTGNRLSF